MRWNSKTQHDSKENEQAVQELKIIEDNIAAAYNFIRQNRKDHFQGSSKIPVHLILGPSRFGKSTIISQSGLNLIDINRQPVGAVTPTKYCTFWFTQDAIYIDTAGTYTKPDINQPRHDLIWRGFIKLLQKYFGKKSINSALIILDLPAIIQDKNLLKTTLFSVRERIYEIATLVKNLHTHIIFTKCDHILGFTDFFALLDAEERLQPFGITFGNNINLDMISTFETKFNELLKHLNNRVIENIQKSSDPKTRALIKIFPSQMDYIRQIFIEVLGKIPHSRNITLSGVYFTSSIQCGVPINPIKTNLLQQLNLQEKSTYNLNTNNHHSYFVEDIFKKVITAPKTYKRSTIGTIQLHIEYLYALLVAGLIIGSSIIIGHQSFHKNLQAINQVKHFIQTQNIADHNALYAITTQLNRHSKSWWLTLGINKAKPLSRSLIQNHRFLFVKDLTVRLENYLSKASIHTDNSSDINKIYNALLVYLMLGNPSKLDTSYIKTWFSNFGIELYNSNEQNLLQQQLNLALQRKFKIEPNQQLISIVRNSLYKHPNQIMYILLKNTYIHQKPNITQHDLITNIYINKNFDKIYNETIPYIVNNPPKYDWVLGDLKLQFETQSTIQKLRRYYCEQYATTWANSITQAANLKLKNLQETSSYLKKLSSATNSPLISLLKQIKLHATVSTNLPIKEFDDIHALNNVNLIDLKHTINNLTLYITNITKSSNYNKAAFDALIEYSRDKSPTHPITSIKIFADAQPLLLKMYLQALITTTWQTLLDSAYDHINTVWNQTIATKYNETLLNKYPLFKESKNDITLEDFNKFFGHHGLISGFFNQYINPLVKIDKTDWSWKKINEQKIHFSPTSLEVFLRAELIKKMFYPANTSNPKIRFTLTPIGMTPHTRNFTLNIDGQKLSFTHNDKKKPITLSWPGPQLGTVILTFVTNQGKTITTSEIGTWAWFRILDKANVTSTRSTKHFELTFDLNGNAAKYILSSKEPVNPFILEIVNNFRCQDRLN